ncbi:MAG: vacuolar protein sorting/targeting protein PEP1, partial [Tremellales sp. Tagirdzhanova-0007]
MAARFVHSSCLSRSPAMVFLLAFLFAALLSVRADDPEVTVTRLQNLPNRLFYFDDTPVILMHDPVTLDVLRSEDEGKSWQPITGVEMAIRLVSHPHNNEMAFII